MSNVGKLIWLGFTFDAEHGYHQRYYGDIGIIYREGKREWYLWNLPQARKMRWDKRNSYEIVELEET